MVVAVAAITDVSGFVANFRQPLQLGFKEELERLFFGRSAVVIYSITSNCLSPSSFTVIPRPGTSSRKSIVPFCA